MGECTDEQPSQSPGLHRRSARARDGRTRLARSPARDDGRSPVSRHARDLTLKIGDRALRLDAGSLESAIAGTLRPPAFGTRPSTRCRAGSRQDSRPRGQVSAPQRRPAFNRFVGIRNSPFESSRGPTPDDKPCPSESTRAPVGKPGPQDLTQRPRSAPESVASRRRRRDRPEAGARGDLAPVRRPPGSSGQRSVVSRSDAALRSV